MQYNVLGLDGKVQEQIALNGDVFDVPYRSDILARVVAWQLAKRRAGTHQVKARADVSGSTRKIVRQKGSGSARHGSRKAPLFVGGGVAFGPQMRSHEHSLPKKVRTLGLRVVLSQKVREEKLVILENIPTALKKTSQVEKFLKQLNVTQGLYLLEGESDNSVKQSCSNLIYLNLLSHKGLNVYDLLRNDKILVTKENLKAIEERLKP